MFSSLKPHILYLFGDDHDTWKHSQITALVPRIPKRYHKSGENGKKYQGIQYLQNYHFEDVPELPDHPHNDQDAWIHSQYTALVSRIPKRYHKWGSEWQKFNCPNDPLIKGTVSCTAAFFTNLGDTAD